MFINATVSCINELLLFIGKYCCRTERALIPADEKRALKILEETTKIVGQQYETGLLWRYDNVKFPDNYLMAKKVFIVSKRNLTITNLYVQILDHVAKGYIRQLTNKEATSRSDGRWYLPIFPVSKTNKPNKVSMVWDAAAKFNGISLNSMLIKGPDQLSSPIGVPQRFRQHKFAICGDIMQMFHQVLIQKEDQDSQRFLWGNDPGNEVTYVMQVMTFGVLLVVPSM